MWILIALAVWIAQEPQNPSPMVEHTRAHPRLIQQTPVGRREKLATGTLFIPEKLKLRPSVPLLIFFHGGDWLPQVAVARRSRMAVISLPATVKNPVLLLDLIAEAEHRVNGRFAPLTLGGWSAGCGAIRELLQSREVYDRAVALLLIDGIHTAYTTGVPGPRESAIETAPLDVWVRYAREAIAGRKRMIVTHSEIFPGTFASTTETADYLLSALNLPRRPVLRWGPMHTQQLSEARAGKFLLIGYAGNSAPDHVDQLHSLAGYLDWLR